MKSPGLFTISDKKKFVHQVNEAQIKCSEVVVTRKIIRLLNYYYMNKVQV